MTEISLIIKKGKEQHIKNGEPWIYRGSVVAVPLAEGAILPVKTEQGYAIWYAYVNEKCPFILGRMVSRWPDPIKHLEDTVRNSFLLRKKICWPDTTCYRVINGEADGFPGLIVDMYEPYAVVQISTLGAEKLKDKIIVWIQKYGNVAGIYEKSDMWCRTEEGLKPFSGVIFGEVPPVFQVQENGIIFEIALLEAQKTGLFLDQRANRELIWSLSQWRSVLNCFCYTGWFSLYAAARGATRIVSLDISKGCIQQVEKNFAANTFSVPHEAIAEDAFAYLRNNPLPFDLIILDPPAFAKKKKDIANATKWYTQINQRALMKAPKGSFILTCSCSYFIDAAMFQGIIKQAVISSKRFVRIVGQHHMAPDHPINPLTADGNYLKSYLLYVE